MIIFEGALVTCNYVQDGKDEYLQYIPTLDKKKVMFGVKYESFNRFDELTEECRELTAKMIYKIKTNMKDTDPVKMLDWLYEHTKDVEKAFNELVLII